MDWRNIKKAPGFGYRIKPITVSKEEIMVASDAHDWAHALDEAMAFLNRSHAPNEPTPVAPPSPGCRVEKVTIQTSFGPISVISDARLPAGAIEIAKPPADPLDEVIDGWTLRDLLEMREARQHDGRWAAFGWTQAQRAAVSAHWSAQLRAKVEAAREAERNTVRVDLQDEP